MIRSLVCTAWFDLARKSLPRPLRPPIFQHQETHGQTGGISGTKRKRAVTDVGEPANTQQIHSQLRTERKRFKNVRVHFTKLPEAPSFRSGRSLSAAAEFGQLPFVAKGDDSREHREHGEDRERWERRKSQLCKRMQRKMLAERGRIPNYGGCAKAAQAPPGALPLEQPQNPPGAPPDPPPGAPRGVLPE